MVQHDETYPRTEVFCAIAPPAITWEKPYKCTSTGCGRAFVTPHSLARHKSSHDNKNRARKVVQFVMDPLSTSTGRPSQHGATPRPGVSAGRLEDRSDQDMETRIDNEPNKLESRTAENSIPQIHQDNLRDDARPNTLE